MKYNILWTQEERLEWLTHVHQAVKKLNINPSQLQWGDLSKVGKLAMSQMTRQRVIDFNALRKTLETLASTNEQETKEISNNENTHLMYEILEQLEIGNKLTEKLIGLQMQMLNNMQLNPLMQQEINNIITPTVRHPKVIVIGANADQTQAIQEHFKGTLEIKTFEATKAPSAKLLKGYKIIVIMSKFNTHAAFDNARVAEKAGSILVVATGGTTRTIKDIEDKVPLIAKV